MVKAANVCLYETIWHITCLELKLMSEYINVLSAPCVSRCAEYCRNCTLLTEQGMEFKPKVNWR